MRSMLSFAVVALFVSTAAMAEDAPKMSADQQAMMEKMAKAHALGPQHEVMKKWAGEWDCTVKYMVDPSQPWQEAKTTSTSAPLFDGRYIQETWTGEMMGQPFSGVIVYGYDNVIGRYVSTWLDNMGTGIMRSEGTPDASGKVITWLGMMSDPTTGKPEKSRMISTLIDDDHHAIEMYGVPPGAKKEMKMMTIEYSRKK